MTRRGGAVRVATTRRHYKDKVYETHLLRRSYREGGRVKTETLGNLSHLPAATMELIRPPCRERDLVVGLVLARVCKPSSKLAATRWWADTTVGVDLGLLDASTDQVYAAMDWLLSRQQPIQATLAARHLAGGGRVLFDLSSSWLEGWACPLAKPGHSRDGKRGKPQIEYGIIADLKGRPVAVEVLAGNTGDPTSFTAAVTTVRERFGLHEVTFVGDRGMITTARITALRKLPGASWITALRAPQIKALAEAGAIQPSLFDQTNLAQITHPDYPDERLVVCRNPALGAERARKRSQLLDATQDALAKLQATVAAGRLTDHTKIAVRAGRIINKYKMAKHFDLHVEHGRISWSRRTEQIQAEAAIDGIYVIRTPLPTQAMPATEVVGVYKSLAEVEADFRSWKATDLQLRPIYHWTEDRVRAHLLLCLLAGYLTWHLRRALAPITFTDTDRPGPARPDPVAPATPSPQAKAKAASKATPDHQPVCSYQTLLEHLATLTRNTCHLAGTPTQASFDKLAEPTPTQRRAFELAWVGVPARWQVL